MPAKFERTLAVLQCPRSSPGHGCCCFATRDLQTSAPRNPTFSNYLTFEILKQLNLLLIPRWKGAGLSSFRGFSRGWLPRLLPASRDETLGAANGTELALTLNSFRNKDESFCFSLKKKEERKNCAVVSRLHLQNLNTIDRSGTAAAAAPAAPAAAFAAQLRQVLFNFRTFHSLTFFCFIPFFGAAVGPLLGSRRVTKLQCTNGVPQRFLRSILPSSLLFELN